MQKKTECCCGMPVQDSDPGTELPEPIQAELDAMGGLDALASRIPPKTKLEARSKIYQALSDPIRLSILYIIKDQPLCVCVINRFMRLSGSKLSYHLNILKESGLIEGEYNGNWIIYSVTERGRRLLQCTEYAGK
jgi:ArsR family transcriptional regulator, arsenate/arsenite/antimonite-responsive transcriptional repressor